MNGVRAFVQFVCPTLQNVIKIKCIEADVEKFMINLVKDTMQYRETHNISRKDLLQLMIQLRNNGTVQKDDVWDTSIVADGMGQTLLVHLIVSNMSLLNCHV